MITQGGESSEQRERHHWRVRVLKGAQGAAERVGERQP